jgi:hypothetical protein
MRDPAVEMTHRVEVDGGPVPAYVDISREERVEATMADIVQKVGYAYVMVPNRKGTGAAILARLREAGVNLLACSGFPASGGKAQIDLVTDDIACLRWVAKEYGWRLSAAKRAFLVQGDDRIGAAHRLLAKLATAKVNVVASAAVAAGKGRYGMILWVKPKDYRRAAKALGAR